MAGKLRGGLDPLSTRQRSSLMSKVKNRGNLSTEIAVEDVLIRHQIRGWVKHPDKVIGKPDFFFPKHMLAVFVDGCFWHCCQHCARNVPKNRRAFWLRKIDQNRRRDNRVRSALRKKGYSVMRIWEHSVPDHQSWLARMMRMLDRASAEQSERPTMLLPPRSRSRSSRSSASTDTSARYRAECE